MTSDAVVGIRLPRSSWMFCVCSRRLSLPNLSASAHLCNTQVGPSDFKLTPYFLSIPQKKAKKAVQDILENIPAELVDKILQTNG